MQRVYYSEEEYYFLRPKPKGALPLVLQIESKSKTENYPKDIFKTKPTTKANPPNKPKYSIYSRIMFRCEECNEEFETKIALNTHSHSHNCNYLENTEYFDSLI